jgi:hypothetical protein
MGTNRDDRCGPCRRYNKARIDARLYEMCGRFAVVAGEAVCGRRDTPRVQAWSRDADCLESAERITCALQCLPVLDDQAMASIRLHPAVKTWGLGRAVFSPLQVTVTGVRVPDACERLDHLPLGGHALTYYQILRTAADPKVMGKHVNGRLVSVLGIVFLVLITAAGWQQSLS